MKYKYKFYAYYNNIRVGKYPVDKDNLDEMYDIMSKQLIMDGLQRGMNIKSQIKFYKSYCSKISKMVDDCYKVKASDFLMFLSCYTALIKFNEIPSTDYLFIKRKLHLS